MESHLAPNPSVPGHDRLIEVVRRADDLSALSEELARSIDDAESELALSRQRHCLLRPLRFRPGDRVLEIGGGYGVLARYLGEVGAEVQSIDDDRVSAEVARIRCRDLENVEIVAADPLTTPHHGDCDWIVLANDVPLPRRGPRTIEDLRRQLATAHRALATTGSLVLAAENRLGLKYLLGARPIGSADPFEALNAARPSDTGTVDLAGMVSEVEAAGFSEVEILLPFPDHLFPKAIVRASAAEPGGISLPNALWGIHGRDRRGEWHAFVDEQRLWGLLQRNGIARSMAPSMLIVASKGSPARSPVEDADAWRFTVGDRYSRFAKSITISRPDGEGRRDVRASRLVPSQQPPPIDLASGYSGRQIVVGGAFHPGTAEAVRIAERFGGPESDVVEAYARWAVFVLQNARCVDQGDPSLIRSWRLAGDRVELIPQNMIWPESSGGPFVFDNEPQLDHEVPLVWVLYRGVIQCMRYHDPVRVLHGIARHLGLTVLDEDVELARRLEEEMVAAFEFPSPWALPSPIDFPMIRIRIADLERELSAANARNAAVLSRRTVRVALGLARLAKRPLRWWRSMTR